MNLSKRKFLFLQGPHGPFFSQLAELLDENGAEVVRIAFNAGDAHYWPRDLQCVEYQGDVGDFADYVADFMKREGVTDLVLYAESRPIHASAIEAAREQDVTTHFFEEGYLRPYWVTYERAGVNGHSPLMTMDMDEVRSRRAKHPVNLEAAPATWGNIWHHNWYGFAYHFQLWLGKSRYKNYRPHRNISLITEWKLNAKRLLILPVRVVERDRNTKNYLKKKRAFHVVLLQLDHDASLKVHSDYDSQKTFISELIEAFSKSAPADLDLVFKLHPLEDQRVPLTKWIKQAAKEFGVSERVHIFFGGKLGELLDHASGALTVNSTAAQQVLWRNLPLKTMGRSVFDKPEFVNKGSLDDYFRNPMAPDHDAFLEYRSFLLETSQIAGGFYSKTSREAILTHILPIISSSSHPYDERSDEN